MSADMSWARAMSAAVCCLLFVPATVKKDGCPLFVCPFDCASTMLPNETCPKCFCQPGERCPFVFCPAELYCVQQLSASGCMHCICQQGTYETHNARKHLISYTSKSLGNPLKEACSRTDAERVRRCASNFTLLLESETELEQRLATTPEIASFLIPYDRLSHVCQAEQAIRDCIPMGPWHRCAEVVPIVRHADAIFRVVCRRRTDRSSPFEAHYTCARNVLSAHADSTYCLDRFRHEVRYRTVNSSFVRRALRIQRCNALENLLDCVKKPLNEKCTAEAARLWQDSFVSVGSVIAPECFYRQGHFAAREYKTEGFSSPLQIFFPVDTT